MSQTLWLVIFGLSTIIIILFCSRTCVHDDICLLMLRKSYMSFVRCSYIMRMKEYERERRLMVRAKKKKEAIASEKKEVLVD